MSLVICNIHFSQQPGFVIWFSSPLMKLFSLTGKSTINVRLGKDVIGATVRPLKRKGHHISMATGLRRAIGFPRPGYAYLTNENREGDFHFGPLIGILIDGSRNKEFSPFNDQTGYIKNLINFGQKKAYLFAFTPRDINWQQERINGWFYDQLNGWTRHIIPLPDVIYNRFINRRAETGAPIMSLRNRFIKKQIPFFNWGFLNKSDVYKLLDHDPEALRYLPESVDNASSEKIKEMLEKHKFLYYKPNGGSLGLGIYRLTYHPKRGYFVRYRRDRGNVLLRFKSFNNVMKMLKYRHGSRLSHYVAQQGIRLMEIDRCSIDFRFHMHKDGNNKWVVAGLCAKKAGRGSVTTHMRTGGSLMTPEQALGRIFAEQAGEVLQKAKESAIKLCEAIERNYTHRIGELGLDIGIDRDGEIWMFEANSKPGRSIFKLPAIKEQGRASMAYILDHCLYLSHFSRRDQT